MKVISSGTLKGGTGKTMVVYNIAGILAEDHKVLMIDNDPQCNLSDSAGIDTANQDIRSVRDIYEDPRVDPRTLIVKGPVEKLPNLDIIPSHLRLTGTEMQLVSRSGREQILRRYIEDHMDVFGEYDYILNDTNPSMGIINQNAFLAADAIILVSDVSRKAVQGAQLFMYLWEENRANLRKEDNVKALIVNNYDQRINLSAQLKEYYEDDAEFADLLISQPVPNRVKLKDTEMYYMPINAIHPKTEECEVFRKIVNELREKGGSDMASKKTETTNPFKAAELRKKQKQEEEERKRQQEQGTAEPEVVEENHRHHRVGIITLNPQTLEFWGEIIINFSHSKR